MKLHLSDIVAALESNLLAEKTALLAGAFDAIGPITAEKEKLGTLLEQALLDQNQSAKYPAYRKRLENLAKASQENEHLLNAAKTGVISARARIQEILAARQTIGVYDADGAKTMAPGAGMSRQKYA